MFPLRLFKNRNFVCLLFCSAFGSMVFYALCILYPEQILVVWGKPVGKFGWYSVRNPLHPALCLVVNLYRLEHNDVGCFRGTKFGRSYGEIIWTYQMATVVFLHPLHYFRRSLCHYPYIIIGCSLFYRTGWLRHWPHGGHHSHWWSSYD